MTNSNYDAFRKGLINRETAELQIDKTAVKIRELADKYNVSAERIRQLEKNAMKKVRMTMEV